MAAKTSEWRPGPTVCRCCLSEGCYKDISTEYFWMGKREVYSEMLSDTFDLSISYSKSGGPNSASRLICEPCIGRLRDAAEFKRQVQECEKTFVQCLDPVTALADMQVTLELEKEVKVEMVKEEKMRLSDDDDYGAHDYGDDDDDYDDLDDQPLTKLASKIPKKEDVDVLDLLDNAKVTEKRKSSTKVKGQPSKKSKCKQTAGSSKQQKPEPKKKKDPVIDEADGQNDNTIEQLKTQLLGDFDDSPVNVHCLQEIAAEIGRNFRVLPSFEMSMTEHIRTRHYSLATNELLQCRWHSYKRHIERRVAAPFHFPSNRDLHFYNGTIQFMPSETPQRLPDHKFKLKLGPGVDSRGQLPIPQELMMKRGQHYKQDGGRFKVKQE
ncbi:uncharacterized protein LOC112047122 isoform X27 [Bicyclus anynana]|uniref:Uncharacterized protein LOC112047122 isoform X27 n=1 Tax=Bicyclus anynana TaxID=110368 RepID=A0ABM3M2G0_BICAN|nr:uncharacterized protein LOC112047122 isoform X27 [Bicyclus anynana]